MKVQMDQIHGINGSNRGNRGSMDPKFVEMEILKYLLKGDLVKDIIPKVSYKKSKVYEIVGSFIDAGYFTVISRRPYILKGSKSAELYYANFLKGKKITDPESLYHPKKEIDIHYIEFFQPLRFNPLHQWGIPPKKKDKPAKFKKYKDPHSEKELWIKRIGMNNNTQFFINLSLPNRPVLIIRVTTRNLFFDFKIDKEDRIVDTEEAFDLYHKQREEDCKFASDYLKQFGFEYKGPILPFKEKRTHKGTKCKKDPHYSTPHQRRLDEPNGPTYITQENGTFVGMDSSGGDDEDETDDPELAKNYLYMLGKAGKEIREMKDQIANIPNAIIQSQNGINERMGKLELAMVKQTENLEKITGILEKAFGVPQQDQNNQSNNQPNNNYFL